MRTTGLNGWRPNSLPPVPEASAIAVIEREEVVVARAASGADPARPRNSSALASSSSAIASTTTSQPARSAASVVTLILAASAPSTFAQSFWAASSARHAEASDRASTRTSDATAAHAASPQAIVPLPAIAGCWYPPSVATGVVVITWPDLDPAH